MTRKQFWPAMIALIFAMMIAGCDNGSSPGNNTNNSEAGIYMGIIGFNKELTPKSISLLDTDTKNEFKSFITSMQMENGTALYWAVDNGLNWLENANLRNDVINVSIVTFTDGLDNVSIDLNNKYSSPDAYRDALRTRISTFKIKDLPLNAYSIGMKGPDVDVTDSTAFTNGLKALASSSENFYEFNNLDQVNQKFEEIAKSLSTQSQSQSIKLKIPGGYKDTTKMRFTFDDITTPTASNLYIEGTYRRGSSRLLQDVRYKGLKSSSGLSVTGKVVEKVFVEFTFENVALDPSGGNVSTDKTKQYYMPEESTWQINSEFGKEGDTQTVVVKKSSVIILILDCTTSLGNTNFSQMKNAANGFIDVLLK